MVYRHAQATGRDPQQVAAQFEATVFRTRETGELPAGSVPTLWTDQQAELQQHLEELGAHQSGAISAAVSTITYLYKASLWMRNRAVAVDLVAPALVRELASKKDAPSVGNPLQGVGRDCQA